MNAITPQIWGAIIQGFVETLIMVGLTSIFTVILGLPLGVLLFLLPQRAGWRSAVGSALNVIVNVTRSFPYAILMVALIPLTRLLLGTSVGPMAASVSLTLAAVPFFGRLVETALRDLPQGKTDAAIAMGSSQMQVIRKVWLPEALPTIIAGITTTVVTIVGYSAMAGIIGGGGLGRLAYNYGFQRWMPEVMVVTIIVLIVIVQLIQFFGDLLARAVDHR